MLVCSLDYGNVREQGGELQLQQGVFIRHSSTDTLATIGTLRCVSGKTQLANNGHERRNSKISHSIVLCGVLEAKIISRDLPEIKEQVI